MDFAQRLAHPPSTPGVPFRSDNFSKFETRDLGASQNAQNALKILIYSLVRWLNDKILLERQLGLGLFRGRADCDPRTKLIAPCGSENEKKILAGFSRTRFRPPIAIRPLKTRALHMIYPSSSFSRVSRASIDERTVCTSDIYRWDRWRAES